MLQQTLENSRVQDTVVITGWKDNTPSAKKEFDFLIISLPLKAIIHIEVKRTLSKKSKEKAINQLNDGYSLISNKVPFPKNRNWDYMQFICFSHLSAGDDDIDQFLKSHSKLHFHVGWLRDVLSQTPYNQPSNGSQASKDHTSLYLNILKYLFHQMFIQEDVLTQGELLFHWGKCRASELPKSTLDAHERFQNAEYRNT